MFFLNKNVLKFHDSVKKEQQDTIELLEVQYNRDKLYKQRIENCFFKFREITWDNKFNLQFKTKRERIYKHFNDFKYLLMC